MNVTDAYTIDDLLVIMQSLRDPQTGCEWDKRQTFNSVAPYTIEEAYEVLDAISRNHMPDLCEELGDLLLQVVYHSQLAHEQAEFTFADVVNTISKKMVRRHPHVFQTDRQHAHLLQDWDAIKDLEYIKKEKPEDASRMAHIASGLPPLQRAKKLQHKAARAQFDWANVKGVLDKLNEEIAELKQVLQEQGSKHRVEDEIGDVLFSVVNVCRHLDVDSEVALKKANDKFEKRFRRMEQLIECHHERFDALSESELEKYWCQAKKDLAE